MTPAVLVVDDDEDVRAVAVATFEDLGLTVHEASSACEALHLLETHSDIRVLFSDVRMPGMNGAELASEAQRRWPKLRIVLTSAYVGDAAIRNVAFVPKPYRLRDIQRAVEPGLRIDAR